MNSTITTPPASNPLFRYDAYRPAVGARSHVVRWLPLKRAELSDQLDRASISVALNIAEGAGRSTPREQARHYAIARGSAFECLAILDLIDLESTGIETAEARALLIRLYAVLTRLCRFR